MAEIQSNYPREPIGGLAIDLRRLAMWWRASVLFAIIYSVFVIIFQFFGVLLFSNPLQYALAQQLLLIEVIAALFYAICFCRWIYCAREAVCYLRGLKPTLSSTAIAIWCFFSNALLFIPMTFALDFLTVHSSDEPFPATKTLLRPSRVTLVNNYLFTGIAAVIFAVASFFHRMSSGQVVSIASQLSGILQLCAIAIGLLIASIANVNLAKLVSKGPEVGT